MKSDSSTNCWGKVGSEWIQKAQTNDFRMYYIMPWTLELLGDISGLKVLDLGCGEGGYARKMAHLGANVTAIDCSEMAIEYAIATAKEEQLAISHFVRNSNDLYGITDDSFDVVLCAMMMMDVEDLNGTLKEIRRILKKQGKVFISILHPCFKPPIEHHWIKENDMTQVVVKNYFRPTEWQGNIAGIEQPVIYRHKTLSEYVKIFADNGFYISDMNEPLPTTLPPPPKETPMAPIWNDPNPVLVTKIEDLQIFSALDNSFITSFEAAPETHSHAFFEVFTALEGEFAVELSGGDSLLIKPDCLCLVPPGVYHYAHSVSEDARKLAVRFSYSCAQESGSCGQPSVFATCRDTLERFRTAQVVTGCEKLCQIIQTIAQERNAPRFASDSYVETLFIQFYIELIRMFREQGETETPQEVTSNSVIEQNTRRIKIENYILFRYQENITEEDLAAEMNLSKRQLSRVLQRTYGKSFRQLLIETRMHRAAQLLQEGGHSIEEIAYLTGYTSLSGFYSAFQKFFGVSVGKNRAEKKTAG